MPNFQYEQPVLSPLALKNALEERRFVLVQPWLVTITNSPDYPNGIVSVPEGFVTDGASIPFPLLLSLFTGSLLRPIGILFEAAIVHDYACVYDGLWYGSAFVHLSRKSADVLFRDMVAQKYPAAAAIIYSALRFYAFIKKINDPKAVLLCLFFKVVGL